jgi:hypothetical protein
MKLAIDESLVRLMAILFQAALWAICSQSFTRESFTRE